MCNMEFVLEIFLITNFASGSMSVDQAFDSVANCGEDAADDHDS